jgi:hypothetical protein
MTCTVVCAHRAQTTSHECLKQEDSTVHAGTGSSCIANGAACTAASICCNSADFCDTSLPSPVCKKRAIPSPVVCPVDLVTLLAVVVISRHIALFDSIFVSAWKAE